MINEEDRKEYLTELRNLFRREMEEHDFCIGEAQVERVFRTLLGEPEPAPRVYDNPGTGISSKEVAEIFEKSMGDTLKNLFERDDTFYRHIKK